ncbi:RidA family protein [Oceanobacillus sp. FSL K6-2867]|uniref:RidA family protein n=1 Tax=Oceanobacillus sp. FSL K6-2867 TaxID=2954748 RepID=UPI0030DAFAD5
MTNEKEMNGLIAQRIATNPDPMERFNISQGFRVGDLLIISGQTAGNEQGGIVGVNDFDKQAEQAFHNLATVLQAGGSDLDRVIKVTIYLTDMSHFPKIIELRKKYFSTPYPADTIVEVNALAAPEFMIEIEAMALVNGKKVDTRAELGR